MPRFSLRDLFLMTTLIAAGICGISFADRYYENLGEKNVVLICLASATALGAAIGTPFQKKLSGAGVFFWLAFVGYPILVFLNTFFSGHHD